ncbi:hypothetical protein T02_13282 [Trichinella nativa]|uniref:Uncharacterized protein n=1 Tax=Trichinella nativa TaxID=6335 RepID=A0A0V1KPT6_9BILA|nr:hypothetical protein T02_13282 [Trichinella nativa]
MGIIANGAQQGHVADNLDGTVGIHVLLSLELLYELLMSLIRILSSTKYLHSFFNGKNNKSLWILLCVQFIPSSSVLESEENQFHFVLRICHNPMNRMTKNNYGSHANFRDHPLFKYLCFVILYCSRSTGLTVILRFKQPSYRVFALGFLLFFLSKFVSFARQLPLIGQQQPSKLGQAWLDLFIQLNDVTV